MTEEAQIPDALSPVKRALLEIRDLRSQISAMENARHAPVAIVGIALRLPGGLASLDSYWSSLETGQSLITEIPAERWDMDRYHSPNQHDAGKMYCSHGAFLKGVDQFDADFFSLSARETQSIDPQQRLLLEVVWEALENATIAPSSLKASQTGIYLGLSNSDYGRMLLKDASAIDTQSVVGGALSIAAGRLAYFFNLRGPAMVVDTACSSSLVALHLACNSLRSNETDLAIVGGANLMLLPDASIGFSKTQMLSRDGRCKVFDKDADGYVRGEGCVAIILTRLAHAQAERLPIHALIRGSAVNQDGRSAGLTAPNGPSQEAVLRSALKAARVEPSQVSYVECHGTGTPLGDPIEVQALANVYSEKRDPDLPLLIGSVKANLGHLEAAAGLGGLVKTVLSMQHECLPPQINFTQGNPHIPWHDYSLKVVPSGTSWSRGRAPRIAGISSFGFSGTNAHVILEEAPVLVRESRTLSDNKTQILLLSARTPLALKELALRYVDHLSSSTDKLSDLCFTSAVGRSHHRERLAICGDDIAALRSGLTSWLADGVDASPIAGSASNPIPSVSLRISGSEIPHAESISERLSHISVFNNAYRSCLASSRALADPPTQDSLNSEGVDLRNHLTSFALQYALAHLYLAWVTRTPAVLGFGFGRHIAACLLGSLPLEEAMTLTLAEIRASANHISPQEAMPQSDATHDSVSLELGPVSAVNSSADTIFALAPLREPWNALLESLQKLYCRGVAINWPAVYQEPRRRVSLPMYPFQRKSFWIPPGASSHGPNSKSYLPEAPVLGNVPPSSRVAIPAFAAPEVRDIWMMNQVRECIRKVLDLDPQMELGPRDRLTDLGIDSLIALELKSLLTTSLDLGDRLASTAVFDAGTVEGLARMVSSASSPSQDHAASDETAALKTLTLEEISVMSDEQVEQLLAVRIRRG